MTELETLRRLVQAAGASLERSRQRIDDLNVYPVPDGDTGTNLALTVHGIEDALEASTAEDRAALAHEATRAALMNARGNSGVILSQIVRGAADELGRPGPFDAPRIARALRSGSDEAYRAVRKPVEGTMLTVIRELAEEAEKRAAATTSPDELLAALVEHGEEAVARTRDQLDVLREAGVVDAGGAGLLEIVRGLAAAVAGEELPEPPEAEHLPIEAMHQELSEFRYCTTFVIEGEGLDAPALERELEQLGDSLLVVGDPTALRVHVHTDDPGAALSLGTAAGSDRGGRDRGHARADRAARGAVARSGDRSRGAQRGRRGRRRRGQPQAVREPRRGEDRRRRPDHEPADGRPARCDRGHAVQTRSCSCPTTATSSWRRSRPRGWPGGPSTSSRPARCRPASPRSSRSTASARPRRTRPRCSRRSKGSPRERSRSPRATPRSTASLRARAISSGASRSVRLPQARPSRRSPGPSQSSFWPSRATCSRCSQATNAPPLDGLLDELAERHPELEIDVHEGGQPHYPLLLSAE